jgi:hypothetical protein
MVTDDVVSFHLSKHRKTCGKVVRFFWAELTAPPAAPDSSVTGSPEIIPGQNSVSGTLARPEGESRRLYLTTTNPTDRECSTTRAPAAVLEYLLGIAHVETREDWTSCVLLMALGMSSFLTLVPYSFPALPLPMGNCRLAFEGIEGRCVLVETTTRQLK